MALDVTNLLNREGEHRKEREREKEIQMTTQNFYFEKIVGNKILNA